MLNIILPDINKLSNKDMVFVTPEPFFKKYASEIRDTNIQWGEFSQKPEIKAFLEKYPNMSVYTYTAYLVTKNNYNCRKFSQTKKKKFGKEKGGSLIEQFNGILGQNVLLKELYEFYNHDTSYIPDENKKGFDGGYDFIVNGMKIDLKVDVRDSYFNMAYAHNLFACQVEQPYYQCDFYLMSSYHEKLHMLQLFAVVPKGAVQAYGKYFAEGEQSISNDGTPFGGDAARYELDDYIINADWSINCIADIEKRVAYPVNKEDVTFGKESERVHKLLVAAENGDSEALKELNAHKESLKKETMNSITTSFTSDFYSEICKLSDEVKNKIQQKNDAFHKTTIAVYNRTSNTANRINKKTLAQQIQEAEKRTTQTNNRNTPEMHR